MPATRFRLLRVPPDAGADECGSCTRLRDCPAARGCRRALDQGVADREAKPHTLRLGGAERFEQAFLHLVCQTGTVVVHRELQCVVINPDRQLDARQRAAGGLHRIQRVVEQIVECGLKLQLIGPQRWQRTGDAQAELYMRGIARASNAALIAPSMRCGSITSRLRLPFWKNSRRRRTTPLPGAPRLQPCPGFPAGAIAD